MRRWLLALALAPALAHADVVGPDPTDCPLGTQAFSCHGLASCRPLSCVMDSDCNPDQMCQARMYCVAQEACASGLVPPDSASPPPMTTARTTCSSACASCRELRVCVPRGTPVPGTAGGCGCRAAAGGASPIALVIAAAVIASLRRRSQPR